MKNLETEFKWNAQTPRAFMCMLRAVKKNCSSGVISASKVLQITDVYLDHADGTFEKEQLAFRVRHYGKVWEATFKTRTHLINGKAVRREETQPLLAVSSLHQALAKLSKQKVWKTIPTQELVPLFTIRNKRRIREILTKHFLAELAFDTCLIKAGEKQMQFKEIELELKRGSNAEFEKFVAKITADSKLTYARKSKVKTALGLLNGTVQ